MNDDPGYFFFQSPWKNIFLWHFMEIEREALIITPVIDMDILRKIQSILIARSDRKLRIRILLRFSENDVLRRGINPETLRILALLTQEPNSKVEIRFLPNLSLTAMVLDDKKALMATGDLSSDSLLEEINYGQMMIGSDIVAAFKEDLMELWKDSIDTPSKEMLTYMDTLKERIELRKELIFEDEEKGIEFSDDEFITLGSTIQPLGKDRQEPHLDETKKIIKELLIRARDAVDLEKTQAALFYLEEGLALEKEQPDLLMEKGKILFEGEHDIEGALACFDKVLDKDDDNRDAWAYSGMCHHEKGEYDDALYAYDQATDIDSQHYPVWIKKGIVLGTLKGREEDALKCLEFSLSQDPYNEEAWYHKASILDQKLKRMDEAILAWRSLLRINPKHVVGSFRMGLLSYKKLNKIDKAKKYFNRVVETDPEHKQAWMFMAEIAENVDDDFSKAYECYENAREHHPEAPELLHREIELLLKHKKKFKKANEISKRLIEIKPKDQLALYVLALGTLRMDNNPEGALKLLNESIRSDPGFKQAILSKANVLAEFLNRAEDAVNLLKVAIKKNKTDGELWLELGINYFDFLYEPAEALKCFEKVTNLDKENAEGWYNKGLVLSRGFEKHQEGLKSLDEATRIDDDHFLAWSEKGRVLSKVYNMVDDGLACLNKAYSIEKEDPSVLAQMADIYRRKKDIRKASEFYQAAIELPDATTEPYLGMADMMIESGRFDIAQSTLNKALQIDPKSEKIWMTKADALRKEGALGKSLECYKRVIRIDPDNQDALNRKTSVEAEMERQQK